MAQTTVRWAIVGTGGIALRTLGDLTLCENAEVVAVCSRSSDSAARFATEHGIPRHYGDFAALCADPEVDAIYLGTPHGTHFAYASEAITAGKNVLSEKPLTMTADEARELQRLSREHGVLVMEAMWMKFSPSIRKAQELVAAGAIGTPMIVQAGLGYPVPTNGPKRFWVPELGGGALYDMGVYTIALAQLFLGIPESISCVGHTRADSVDYFEGITLTFANGAIAQLTTSITYSIPPRGYLGGTTGSIDFAEPLFSPPAFRHMAADPPRPPVIEEYTFEKEGAGYVPMFRAAGEAILAGEVEHAIHPMSATIAVLETMETVRAQLLAQRDHNLPWTGPVGPAE